MTFEISPEEYWITCSPEEALVYCFSLEIDGKTGWRLPKMHECILPCDSINRTIKCIPVRDI